MTRDGARAIQGAMVAVMAICGLALVAGIARGEYSPWTLLLIPAVAGIVAGLGPLARWLADRRWYRY